MTREEKYLELHSLIASREGNQMKLRLEYGFWSVLTMNLDEDITDRKVVFVKVANDPNSIFRNSEMRVSSRTITVYLDQNRIDISKGGLGKTSLTFKSKAKKLRFLEIYVGKDLEVDKLVREKKKKLKKALEQIKNGNM